MRRQSCVLWILCLIACGGGEAKPATTAESKSAPTPVPASSDGPIELPQSASFGELIQTINQQSEPDDMPTATCLVAPSSSFILRAPAARAMRPLPPAPNDLDALFAAVADPVRLLTRWGQLGVEADRLVAVTFTPTSAETERPILAALTDHGILLRSDAHNATAMTRARALEVLESEPSLQRLVVTAEKSVPLRDVYRWLQDLQSLSRLSVVLAVMLPEGTRVPESPPESDADLRCGELDSGAVGNVDVSAVQRRIFEIKSDLATCLEVGGGSRGGAVHIRLELSESGTVDKQCIADGSLNSAASERCVVEELGKLGFGPPSPPGSRATLLLPITLRPKAEPPIRPLCQ